MFIRGQSRANSSLNFDFPLGLIIKPFPSLGFVCSVCSVFASQPYRAVTPVAAVPCLPLTCCLTLKNLWVMCAIWSLIFSSSPHLAVKIQLHPSPSADVNALPRTEENIRQGWTFYRLRDMTKNLGARPEFNQNFSLTPTRQHGLIQLF